MNPGSADPRSCVRQPARVSCVNCPASRDCLPGTSDVLDGRRIERLVVRRSCLEAGEHLYRMDQPVSGKLYAIRSGQVKVYQLSPQGVQQVADFAGAGDVLGMEAAGLDRYRCSAVALCDSTLCEFSLAQLMAARAAHGRPPELARLLSRALAREEWLTVQVGHNQAMPKLVAFLLAQAARQSEVGAAHVPLRMTRQDLGDFLRLTPATVSRLLCQLERAGLLRLERHGARLLDAAALQRLAARPAGRADAPPPHLEEVP